MNKCGSIQPGSAVGVEPPERPDIGALVLSKGDALPLSAPGRPEPFPMGSLVRGSRCVVSPDATPARAGTTVATQETLAKYRNTKQNCSFLPLQRPIGSFARLYIFDWDNTLCPTDWLCELYSRHGLSVYTAKSPCPALCSPLIRGSLAALESSVRRLLHKCRKRGQVAILSNATSIGLAKTMRLLPLVEQTLAELSARPEYPRHPKKVYRGVYCSVRGAIPFVQVEVLSARDMCEPHGLPLEKWKDTALVQLVTAFIRKRPHHRHSVMTIGDQEFEHIALHNAAAHLMLNFGWECHPKCIKYVENPSLQALTRQTLSFTDLLDRFADDESGMYWMQRDETLLGVTPSPLRHC